jgi:hypothetical protein
MADPDAPKARHACAVCDRDVDDCSFCGEPDCPAPMCYPDTLLALGLQVLQPHAHGG